VRNAFFDSVRDSLFKGRLKQGQVDGLNTLLDEWAETGYTNRQWLAYCLATAFHETAFTMQPIKERGGTAYFRRMYDIKGDRPHVARSLGNDQPGDGAKYAGRGYVQITGKRNYKRASQALGIDFVANPDGVMEPGIAAHLLYVGCAEGWFTGKELADYINDRQRDYWNARRVVNGTDKAGAIADYALRFEAALDAAGDMPVQKPVQPENSIEETELHWLVRLIKWAFNR
jgi:putative chitinase